MPPKDTDIIQVSITMESKLKKRYTKLATEMDMSFSQLVRFSLKQVERGVHDLEAHHQKQADKKKGQAATWPLISN